MGDQGLAGGCALSSRHLVKQGRQHTVVAQKQRGLVPIIDSQTPQTGQQQPQQFRIGNQRLAAVGTEQFHTALKLFLQPLLPCVAAAAAKHRSATPQPQRSRTGGQARACRSSD